VKNVTLSEEHLHDHFPFNPVMPASLMIEGMAQTGGILLGETRDWDKVVILAKIPKITFHERVAPGDTLVYSATLVDHRAEGGAVNCTAHVGDRLIAEGEILFVHADHSDPQLGAIDQKSFVMQMNIFSQRHD
jgi:3-hydroxyacyl-[acyl-carrier-protein] dehydratase